MTNAVAIAQQGSNNTTFRNRIINGACAIDQRNNGTYAAYASGSFIVDRFCYQSSQASKFVLGQNLGTAPVTAPAGFPKYIGAQVSSAVTVGSSEYFQLYQIIEGYNIADLAWGSSSAKTVTLSFWVQSSLTGTFGGSIQNAATDRSYPYTYTISSANTWTKISVTIPGCTDGTWATDNSVGMIIKFSLGMGTSYSGPANTWASVGYSSATGATSVVGTNGATFYLTGVQLEAGSAASPFENRLYDVELAACQRYYFQTPNVSSGSQIWDCMGVVTSTTSSIMQIPVPVTMRASPSVSIYPAYNVGSYWNINVPSINNYPLTANPYLASYSGGCCVPIVALHNAMPASYIGLGIDFYCPTGTAANNIILSAEL